jgi:hypothetical protein
MNVGVAALAAAAPAPSTIPTASVIATKTALACARPLLTTPLSQISFTAA